MGWQWGDSTAAGQGSARPDPAEPEGGLGAENTWPTPKDAKEK